MKPRHAAALTLIGWYLLVPPLESVQLRPGPGKDEDTLDWKTPSHPPPLSAWSIEGSYDTARECREAKRDRPGPVGVGICQVHRDRRSAPQGKMMKPHTHQALVYLALTLAAVLWF